MSSSLLIVLSGNPERLRQGLVARGWPSDPTILVSDEKSIINFKAMMSRLRGDKYAAISFGCKNLTLQRYQFILNSYLLLARAGRTAILDEQGRFIEYSLVRYFAVEVPRFFAEITASVFVVAATAVRLRLLRSSLRRKQMRIP